MEVVNLTQALKASWDIILGINGSQSTYSKYSKVYFMATESIKSYLKDLYVNVGGKALTVLSSGDHIFNLAYEGITKIDAFDINQLTYFIFNLRRAIALSKDYNDFISANLRFGGSNNIEYSLELVEELKSILSPDVYKYYIDMLMRCLNTGVKFSNLYREEGFSCNDAVANNLYLSSEEDYKKMQHQLERVEVNYHFGDARNIALKLQDDAYSCILLSNIADYIFSSFDLPRENVEKIQSFIDGYYRLLEDNGVLVNYSFGFGNERLIYGNIPFESIDAEFSKVPYYAKQGYYLVRKKHGEQYGK